MDKPPENNAPRPTVETRKKIGFLGNPEEWANTPAVFDEHTLRIAGHPVMEDWERSYMERLADIACANKGNVLELGYGLGLSARAIQSHDIDNHYIVECNIDVIEKCIEDLRGAIAKSRVHVLSGFWHNVTPTLPDGFFSGILFDTYPLTEEEIHSNHFWFFKEAYRLLKPGGTLTYYSDEATEFSKEHLAKLIEAGFKKENIGFEVCQVDTPPNCEYWQAKTMIAPIIKK